MKSETVKLKNHGIGRQKKKKQDKMIQSEAECMIPATVIGTLKDPNHVMLLLSLLSSILPKP
jgi:hypothetical protein